MHADSPFRIDLSTVTNSPEPLRITADEAFFKAINDSEILGGKVEADIKVSGPRAGVYQVRYHIQGYAITPCDRCNEPIRLEIDCEDERFVTSYDSDTEPTDEAPLAERGNKYDLSHDIFETMALTRPLRFCHEDNNCNPDVTTYIGGMTEE